MKIPTILKGDTAAAIPFTVPESAAELAATYQGATRRFEGVTQGSQLAISFTAAETAGFRLGTFPVVFWARFANGAVKTYPITAKIKVTDCPGLVYSAELELEGFSNALTGIDAIPDRHTQDQVAAKLNEVITRLGGGSAAPTIMLCLALLGGSRPATAAEVQTAPLGGIYNDAPVVTNVTFDGLATSESLAAISLEPVTNYTDGVASDLLGSISQKADMYRYEGGATSNVLVSCQWLMSAGSRFCTLRESEGQSDSWFFTPGTPTHPRLGGTSYVLTYRDADGWVLELQAAVSGHPRAYTNRQDRSSATLDFDLGAYVLTRTNEVWAASTNRYPVVYHDELGGVISTVVTKPFVEGLGIESGVQSLEPATNYTDEAIGEFARTNTLYATTSALAAVGLAATNAANAAATASLNADTALRLVMGENVWFLVTNYMRTVEGVLPSLELWEVRDNATNLVYSSKEEITNLVQDVIHDCKTNLEATVAAATNEMPSKAWGRYQSTGADNPQPGEVLLVNEPTVIMTGGGEWNRYIETGGSSVWVLQSNGHVSFGGDTNGNFFAVKDDEGGTHFKVARTDSYEVDALPIGTGWSGGDFVVTYNSNIQPVLYATTNLTEAFEAESGGRIDSLGMDVSWTQSGTNYVATIQQDARHPALFVHAKVTQEGGVAIINSAPTRFDGGIQIGNQKYSIGTYNDGTRTFLTLEATP